MRTRASDTAAAKRAFADALEIPVARVSGNARYLEARVDDTAAALAAVPAAFALDDVAGVVFLARAAAVDLALDLSPDA